MPKPPEPINNSYNPRLLFTGTIIILISVSIYALVIDMSYFFKHAH